MKYLIVKVKDQELFFNADEGMGEYICSTPMLLDKEQADSIMKYCKQIFHIDEQQVFYNHQLEVKEVELKIL
jgi:hypothetical protein